MKKIELNIKGMHCKSCSMLIADIFIETKGVTQADVSLQNNNAIISFDEKLINEKQLIELIKKEGYDAKLK